MTPTNVNNILNTSHVNGPHQPNTRRAYQVGFTCMRGCYYPVAFFNFYLFFQSNSPTYT